MLTRSLTPHIPVYNFLRQVLLLALAGSSVPGWVAMASAPPTDPVSQSQEPSAPTQETSFSEAIDVRLAELYVTVVDKKFHAVPGLTMEDFLVFENQVPQELSSATDSRELPITLGLAIDTSASMFIKLPAVVKAAKGLIAQLSAGKDRAFLVGFGGTPELVLPTTTELSRFSAGFAELEPEGRTPLWSSVSLCLSELERSRGKRALIVFLDGADEDERSVYKTALDRAQAVAVPVYLIVMNNEAARSSGKDFQTRSFISRLERMAAAGGGRVIYVPTHADLATTYQEIAAELRSAYLLTYYPTVPLAQGGQRDVQVKVPRKGVKVRTVSGYKPLAN